MKIITNHYIRLIILLLSACIVLSACSNKDAEEEAEIVNRPIKTCEGLQAENGRAYIDGESLHISVSVTAPRKISTYRLHGPTSVPDSDPSVNVYELNGFFGQDYEEDEYVTQLNVLMPRPDSTPQEIVIKCRDNKALMRITLDRFKDS